VSVTILNRQMVRLRSVWILNLVIFIFKCFFLPLFAGYKKKNCWITSNCGSPRKSIGSLSDDDGDGDGDGDGNENDRKAIGLDCQNNNFARASRFLEHFLAVVARPRRESAQFHVLSRTGTQDNHFFFLEL